MIVPQYSPIDNVNVRDILSPCYSNISLESVRKIEMKIAVLANLIDDAPLTIDEPPGRWDELDDWKTIQSVLDSLTELGHECAYFPADLTIIQTLPTYHPELVFNMAEGHFGKSREAQIPAILDMLRIPYTASGVLGMSLSHNKDIAKPNFRCAGLPTPDYIVVHHPNAIPVDIPGFPLFIKPAHEGSSIGINSHAVVHTRAELEAQVQWCWDMVHSDILIESYIVGREFTLGVLGRKPLPIVEIVSPTGYYSSDLKEDSDSGVYRICPAELSLAKTVEFQEIVLAAMDALALYDVCRMDLRMDAKAQPYILEVNPLPLLDPDPAEASIAFACQAAGMSFTQMVGEILFSAMQRHGLN